MPIRKAFFPDGKSIFFEDTFEKRQELIKNGVIYFDAFSYDSINNEIVTGDLIINSNYHSLNKNLSCTENLITMMTIDYGISPASLVIQIRKNFVSIVIKKRLSELQKVTTNSKIFIKRLSIFLLIKINKKVI